ncbi:UNVERIFIED_CONTAM: hypothetical protein NCL1_41294 [Trichonephila clavipes]
MTVKPAVDDMVLDVHTLSRTKVIRMSCMVKQNQSQTVAQLTTQYNSGPNLQDPSGSDLKPQNASKNSSVADEFDMFAQSRNTSFGSIRFTSPWSCIKFLNALGIVMEIPFPLSLSELSRMHQY